MTHKNTLTIQNIQIPYEIKQNTRLKHIKLSIGPEGLQVGIPLGVSASTAEDLLKAKSQWILEHYMKFEGLRTEHERRWEDGADIFYLGKAYSIKLMEYPGKGAKALLKGEHFEVFINRGLGEDERKREIEEAFRRWFIHAAEGVIHERLTYYSGIIGVSYKDVRLKEQKTRWGSCSKKGNLNFNWRLVMAPLWVLDYVIVHELCHLIHLNHSKDFWNTVAAYMPDYTKAVDWLKENGGKLQFT